MTMVKMIATKSLPYGTRMLEAGDPFEATERDSKLLRAVKKAKLDDSREALVLSEPPKRVQRKIAAALKETTAPKPGEPPVPQPEGGEPDAGSNQGSTDASGADAPGAGDDIAAVRAEYFEKMGKRAFMGWDITELRKRLAAPAQS